MKVILYMGISINGNIAREDGTVDWNSEAGWNSFFDHGKAAGNFVMGRKTFEIAIQDGSFPFEGAVNVVMTHESVENTWSDRVVFTDKDPVEVVEMVAGMGFGTMLLIGGGILNTSFAKEKIIDEVYLDIEPIAFGRGRPLFDPADFEMNLSLLASTKLSSDTVQLHYRVLK